MFDKLRALEDKFNEINERLMQPEVVNDSKLYTELMIEYRDLQPIVEKLKEYDKAKAEFDEAVEMMNDGGLDKDMKEMVQEQYDESKTAMAQLEDDLKILLLPKDPNDDRNVIIEIRGGAGGEEAALFANSLYRMYTMYAAQKGWQIDVMSANETELGGYKEITFTVSGQGAYSRLKYESGVHRVQRVPETESQGRVHTSTVTVAVLPEAEEVELDLNEERDIKMEVFRSSGAGGQHINKTSSAVRLIHIPTGTVVECQNERSQFQNRDKALKMLRAKLLDEKVRAQENEIASNRRSQVGTGDRSEKIRTYNFPESRISDHRIKLTLYKLEQILNGNLDEVIDALATADQAAKLAAQQEE
ncbi:MULTISPECIES: peptide chain release factor 1 [Ruminococcus]|uniref:Peptide chain release factor 1 n=1 Tax=Ruminococcus albus 8 TaxID=246199 RepID=E9SCX0_RUMAL|nr:MULTISPECIES: peptide chain release factor 1 [Ruminococcus]MBE6874792.1 peptide chain release factor 1 [Ruminococcus albus]EGC02852.1 peptide chain release factor 1 [Ruminococcus albus 8]MBO5557215.1 peptide chain release factor 1 [Ruminococcus sp.]MBQ9540946.1 peptide chain release factor 1 [Ruminococcus sp.]MBR0528991.1 peptide chain release factor 1 [Ruminococcus sp.]